MRNKSPLFWIGGAIGGCLLLILCGCCIGTILMTSNPEFKEGYCSEWVAQGNNLEDEPFGWCD